MNNLYNTIISIITNIDSLGITINCLLIVIESIIPPLPLALFITILYTNYGPIIGFLCSWICTVIGCLLSFFISKKLFKKSIDKKIRNYDFANNLLKVIDKLEFKKLILLISCPFTPAFLINILSGVSNMNPKKFFLAIVIGKIFIVFFWGYIGINLIASLKNPIIIIKVALIFLLIYLFSKYINKRFNLDGK